MPAKKHSLRYRVFSADPVRNESQDTVDGEDVTVVRDVLSVQLVPEGKGGGPTLTINPSRAGLGDNHPFVEGGIVEVTFSEVS